MSQYSVDTIDSPAGQVQLVKRRLTTTLLAVAIAKFQTLEKVRVGTGPSMSHSSTSRGCRSMSF